ncbi:MAG: hypothetical protein KDH97_10145 [Calditrichaeota bacterium]|nr:hypothetical protein [Calditrichota bacterium]MCB9087536.1 hypothetical protein [Calditrichia bacterium]MCB0290603.1 hypothetical protein [Calditrichota bacterium]MCB0294443.1 hypothetical protein [Calditrichota bacterium]MCB0303097.1 hypothetical protein [Calditrichota bacterium]
MKLRFKILSGFFALALMLALAGVWSIYELNTIGTSAHDMLKDNYQSVHAANTMLEALEREDSGILLLMLGKWEEGRRILDSGDSLFWSGFDIAQHNLTIPGEKRYIDIIREKYNNFKQVWEKPIVSTYKERNVDWYFENIHADFLAVKSAINDLRHINSETMYRTATSIKDRSNRAVMPGIIAITAALVFGSLFNFFINYYVVNPLLRINRALREYLQEGQPLDIEIETNDELKELSNLLNALSARAD